MAEEEQQPLQKGSHWKIPKLRLTLIVATLLTVFSVFATNSPTLLSIYVASGAIDGRDGVSGGRIEDGSNETMTNSPLHDKTITWIPGVERLWMDYSTNDKKNKKRRDQPPAMLLLTDIGWNQPNQTAGLQIFRGIRARELVEGVVNHPWFHPTAWEDLNSGKVKPSDFHNDTRFYVFVDRDTCYDRNYPIYGKGLLNRDHEYGRGDCCLSNAYTLRVGQVVESRILSSPMFGDRMKLVIFDCGGWGPKAVFQRIRTELRNRAVIASLSAQRHQHRAQHDQGLPPGACTACDQAATKQNHGKGLTCSVKEQEEASSRRPYLLTFAGRLSRSKAREELAKLHNGNDVIIVQRFTDENSGMMNATTYAEAFRNMATRSQFGATPRGDNVFSYRFSEIISCGAIPVVYADNWVWPFEGAVNWEEVAVSIPENRTNETIRILESISLEKRCRMRRKLAEIYDRYMKNGRAVIRGLVESMEKRAMQGENHSTTVLRIPWLPFLRGSS